jgi:hypothetical protein
MTPKGRFLDWVAKARKALDAVEAALVGHDPLSEEKFQEIVWALDLAGMLKGWSGEKLSQLRRLVVGELKAEARTPLCDFCGINGAIGQDDREEWYCGDCLHLATFRDASAPVCSVCGEDLERDGAAWFCVNADCDDYLKTAEVRR